MPPQNYSTYLQYIYALNESNRNLTEKNCRKLNVAFLLWQIESAEKEYTDAYSKYANAVTAKYLFQNRQDKYLSEYANICARLDRLHDKCTYVRDRVAYLKGFLPES